MTRVYQEKVMLAQQLQSSNKKLSNSIVKSDQKSSELAQVLTKFAQLEKEFENKSQELFDTQRDMEILGEKLTDAIEQRAELQHSKEVVQDELEELTRSLFEEANSMVANEARQRHEHQEKVDYI